MIDFLISVIPASLFIYGFHILFQEDHLLERWGLLLRGPERDRSPDRPTFRMKLMKPLIDCPICMSSVWGTIWFFIGLSFGFDIVMPIKLWIPYVFSLCGLNTIIQKFTTKERIIVEE